MPEATAHDRTHHTHNMGATHIMSNKNDPSSYAYVMQQQQHKKEDHKMYNTTLHTLMNEFSFFFLFFLIFVKNACNTRNNMQ